MKQNFRRLLLCLSLAAAPFLRMEAHDWVPVGDSVDAHGFARTGGVYLSQDYVGSNSPHARYNRPLTTSSLFGADNTINMYGTLYTNNPANGGTQQAGPIPCTLKINGDVELTATDANMTININEDVVLEPYFEHPVTGIPGGDVAQVYFNVAAGRTINVNVDHNLEFRGKTTTTGHRDMIVTFAGKGQVTFNMADGTSIWFNGQNDTSSPLVLDSNGLLVPCADRTVPSTAAAGTKVFVLMDQSRNEAVSQDKNKVVFQRATFAAESNRVLIGVGPNSVFTYLSTNPTGVDNVGGSGYGAVAFDPTNPGIGRMVLFIRGAYATDQNPFLPGEGEVPNPDFGKITEKFPFNDGAVIVGGSFVPAFDPVTIAGSDIVGETETPAPGYDFSKPAGVRAIMRVVDNKLFANSPQNPYNPSTSDRRGLLVVNDVASHGKLASDPYWDLYAPAVDGFIGTEFAYSNPANSHRSVRKGFVLAVNGLVDVYHNTFLDHVAGFANQCDPLASCDFADPNFLGNANWIKPRNPSAFIVDGLDTALFVDGNPYIPGAESAGAPSQFVAADPYTQVFPTQAEMFMRGTGTVNFVSAASAKYGYLFNFWTSGPDPLFDIALDYTAIFDLGTSTYNGIQLDPLGLDVIQSGEGNHVFDAEGPLFFVSFQNFAFNRTYATSVFAAGVFNAASLLLDYKGREVLANGTVVVRPLLADGSAYDRYNSPTLFFNDNVSFFDGSTVLSNDATKFVDGIPALSEPGMTGGERLWFSQQFWGATAGNEAASPNRFRFPEVQFFNSTLALHENLNASGLRFVVKTDTIERGLNNKSFIQFFDHGDDLDSGLTGFGRIFLCGSALNNFCDGASNVVGETCPFNVFTTGVTNPSGPFPTGAAVTLSLKNGDEFTPDLLAAIAINPALKEKQRAHHLFMFSQPPHAAAGAYANLAIGWGASATSYPYPGHDGGPTDPSNYSSFSGPGGDAGFFPGSFPYPGEPLITDPAFFTSIPTSLDALQVNPAVVSVDGSIICFGSFDQAGNSIQVPLQTDNDSGAVFVKHGGKLTITRQQPYVFGVNDHSSITYQTFLSTMIGQRLWNDYNFAGDVRVVQLTGDLDLPHDQTVFDNNMTIQPYNITKEMFAARRADTQGYVRLSFENTSRSPYFDTTGAEEVSIGWFYRDTPDFTLFPTSPDVADSNPLTGGNIIPVKSQMLKTKLMHKHPKTNWMTRAMESIDTPFPRPADLLFVGPGDDIVQMQVSGATQSDPFVLDISGDGILPVNARVREFVSLKSTRNQVADHFIGEGAHATLYVELNGRFGLGSRKWNENSVNAWNVLGKDFVTICPLGDGTIDLNDDVLVADRQALVASDKFGNGFVHRVTFTSDQPREIRVPAGMELDLSSFGRGDHQQQLAFGGQVKLIFEEGATLRLPDAPTFDSTGKPNFVLYFNDQAELIFEGGSQGGTYLPFVDTDAAATSANARIRIIGQGQIWLNKNAHLRVNDTALVGVETDLLTPITDLTISIQREGRMDIGDETLPGGAFQVGNPTLQEASISFTLALGGPTSTFHIDREGFFGLGAGVFNKDGNVNGSAAVGNNPVVDGNGVAIPAGGFPQFNPDTTPAGGWQIKPLFNVASVNVQIANGIFDHSNIFDGSSSNASLLAVGPAGSYVWSQSNQDVTFVRGGGNLMLVPSTTPLYSANVWNYAGQVATGESYGILASGQLLLDREVTGDLASVVTPFGTGRGATFTFASGTNDAKAAGLFGLFSYVPYSLQGTLPGQSKRVDLGTTAFVSSMALTQVNTTEYPSASFAGAQISRLPSPASIGGGTIADAINRGSLNATGATEPSNFTANP